MKVLALAVLCLVAVNGALADSCYHDVTLDCGPTSSSLTLPSCNAIYGAYDRRGSIATELQAYASLHLQRSYDYLLSAAHFNSYQTDRAGFRKLFKKLSDEAWEKTIEIVKHITMRGDEMNFFQRSTRNSGNYTVELHEMGSLARALDSQKEIAERAFHIHREATRNKLHLHDPEIGHYIKVQFIEPQAKSVRLLAGYAANLRQFTDKNGQDLSVSLYLFDEYLQSVV